MSSQRTFLCPSCGASLTPQGSQPEITCGFCGATVVVPPELRTQPPVQPPSSPVTPPSPQPQIVIIEQTPPIFINNERPPYPGYPPQAPYQQPYPPRRRNGCGCGCGCLGPIIGLLVTIVVIAAILYTQAPGTVRQIIDRAQSMAASFNSGPQIITFTAAPASVAPGGTVNLLWATNGDTVKLERLTPPDTRSWSVQAFGNQSYTFSSDPGDVVFRLTVTKNGKSVTRNVTVTVRRR